VTVTTVVTGLRTRPVIRKFVKFSIVGLVGVVVNTAALFVGHDQLDLPLWIASPIAVEIAILNNFVWNNYWTFRTQGFQWSRAAKFNLVSLGGLVITTVVLNVLVEYAGMFYLIANLIAIGVAMSWNFAINFLWTWRQR
jgi:dolichol-phosphate mannosyltransferase